LIGLFISKDMPQAEGRFLSGKAMRVKRHLEAITPAPTTKEPRIHVIFAPEGLPFDFWG